MKHVSLYQRIDEINPTSEEYEEIIAELPRVENAESLAQAGDAAYYGLAGERGVIALLNDALMQLESMRAMDSSLDALCASLTDASYVIEDAARDVRAYRDSIDRDPAALERLQERMGAMQGLMRAYGPRMQDVLERRAQAAELVSSVDDADRKIEQATRALDQAEQRLAGAADAAQTLVFDEVDAGVGGTAALALADVLADLAATHQVIVVTHLAQIAVRAQTHYVVKKVVPNEELPQTELSALQGEERVCEVARMLSGDASEASLAHARDLMAKAAKDR